MAEVLKVLGQAKPSAATLTALYTVPAATTAAVSTIMVCNQSATPTSFRISIAPAGVADTPSQYIYYDILIAGNDSFAMTCGVSLEAASVIRVYNTLATCSFSAFGAQIT